MYEFLFIVSLLAVSPLIAWAVGLIYYLAKGDVL